MEVALSMICTIHPDELGCMDGICWDLFLAVWHVTSADIDILTGQVPLSALFLVVSLFQG